MVPSYTLVASAVAAVNVKVFGATVIAKVAVPVPPKLVAEIVTLNVPTTVGVPEITPVEVFKVKPAGKVVEP